MQPEAIATRRWAAAHGLEPRPSAAADRVSAERDSRIFWPGMAIAGMVVLGMGMQSTPLTLAGSGLALLVAVISPGIGVIILAATSSLGLPVGLPAPGLPTFLVAATLIGCVGRMPLERRRLTTTPMLLLLLAFALYVFAQQVPEMLGGWQGEQGYRTGFLLVQLATLLGAIIATAFVVRAHRPHPYLAALVAGSAVAAGVAIAAHLAIDHPLVANLIYKGSPRDVARAIGPFADPNYFGTYLATAAVLTIAFCTTPRRLALRILVGAIAVMLVLALVLTLSRGALVAFALGLIALAFVRGRATGLAALAGCALVAGLLYPMFLDVRLQEVAGAASVQSHNAQAQDDANGRLEAALIGPTIFATSPVFGIGLGYYYEASVRVASLQSGVVPHNWYIGVLVEQGIVGIVLWICLLLTTFRYLWTTSGLARRVGIGVLITAAVGGVFLQTPMSYQTSALPAIAVTAAVVAGARQRQSRSAGKRSELALPTRRPALVARHAVR